MSATLSRRALLGGRLRTPSEAGPPEAGPRIAAVTGNCLATAGVACGICADPCEPHALRVKPELGGRARPVIDAAACTGCGDCLPICPVGSLALVPTPQETTPCA